MAPPLLRARLPGTQPECLVITSTNGTARHRAALCGWQRPRYAGPFPVLAGGPNDDDAGLAHDGRALPHARIIGGSGAHDPGAAEVICRWQADHGRTGRTARPG